MSTEFDASAELIDLQACNEYYSNIETSTWVTDTNRTSDKSQQQETKACLTTVTYDDDIEHVDERECCSKDVSYTYVELTEDELYVLATLVYLEAGSESYECQKAVASVILNRMITQDKSLEQVVYASNQFTPACLIPYSDPSESALSAAIEVATTGATLPLYVTYFRADFYHSFTGVVDYTCIDNTYFSADVNLM